MVEKRGFKRVQENHPVTLRTRGSGVSFQCQTIDISRTGISVKSKDRLLPPSLGSLALRRMLGYQVDHIVTASYLPEQVVTNKDIIKMGFKGPAFLLERALGAKERRAAAPDETAADMMTKVAKKILDKA